MEVSAMEENSDKQAQPLKVVVLADLNVDPPEFDDEDTNPVLPSAPLPPRLTTHGTSQEKLPLLVKEGSDVLEGEGKRLNKMGKCRPKSGKVDDHLDCGVDGEGDQHSQGAPSSREEKVSSLKTGLIHVSRKAPKNAHAHFLLGLMYQRLGQPQKAVPAYEKAAEILLRSDEEIDRPELLSLVQMHHAQCLLLESPGECASDKELEPEELEEICSKLKESVQSDIRQVPVWNTLGIILLKSGRLQSAISVLSSLLALAPHNLDCLANLGLAHLQSGNVDAASNYFQELIMKDQAHPSALVNYATILLCKYGSAVAGAGAASAGEAGAESDSATAINVAKECLLAAIKADPKAAHTWANLANAYGISGDHRSSSKCLEKAAKLEPNCMSTRYSIAVHRIQDAERSLNPIEQQLSWAGNEMASILREADPLLMDPPIAWAGLAMVHQAQHEIAAAFESEPKDLMEAEEHAICCLKQAIGEDPDDAVHWHQLGLHSLRTQQFKLSQKYLKAAVSRSKECSYAWSNLGISLQLAEETSQAEEAFKRALLLANSQQAHAIFSNLGNFYRQVKKYDRAKAMFSKALELRPGYAPAYNNLGLVFAAQGLLDEAKFCFDKALLADPLLDAAKSNMLKVSALSKICTSLPSNMSQG
ncbi:putative UDP-N-acetylglucosamine--peptide N-acetylglucosaminyltransferase SEC [Bienertia sinuspersici]